MLVVICGSLVDFSVVLLMSHLSSGSLEIYSTSLLRLAVTLFHSIVSIPALVGGLWLVALWRPESTSFPAKSKRIAQITSVSWVLSYVAGVLSFVVLHTTFFGLTLSLSFGSEGKCVYFKLLSLVIASGTSISS